MIVKARNELELSEELIVNGGNKKADFETAISAAGFGKFNILLLLATLPTCWSLIFELTSISYVFPAAQCDLELSLEDKGMLSSVTFAGMLVSSIFWGFLFDTYGRRRLLMIAFFTNGLFVMLSSLSQTTEYLMVMKFMEGFIISGPFSAAATYFSELHDSKNRSRIPLIMGGFYSLGGVFMPFLASFILPLESDWQISDKIVFHPWSLFLLINSLPSLLSGLIFSILPESPKFLMSMGKNEEALQVFRKIYSINTGKRKTAYPIKELIMENQKTIEETSKDSFFRSLFKQIRPLFERTHLKNFILVCFLQIFMNASFFTLRIWMPQLFQIINDYKFFNNGTSSNLCEMMASLHHDKATTTRECFVNFANFEVYLNSMTVCLTALVGYLIAGSLINLLGQNKLLGLISLISGCSALGIYFSPNGTIVTIFIAVCSSTAGIGTNAIIVVMVNLFPTTLRAKTLSLAMTFGRLSVMTVNMIFPYLLEMGCFPPFFVIALLGIACSVTTMLLPKKNKNFT